MIVITIDGLNWETAKEYMSDVFKIQSMRMIRNNVRVFTNTPEKAQPTTTGLICLWSGRKIKEFNNNLLVRMHPSYGENYPLEFLDKNNNKMDLLFNHFDRNKLQVSLFGPNPYYNNEIYYKYFKNLDNVTFCPTEELCIFPELFKSDYDLFWIHTVIGKMGVFQIGPYIQGRIPSLIQYDEIRKNIELKKDVYLFGLKRYKYLIKNYIEPMFPNEIIVITSDHGIKLDKNLGDNYIDEIPFIINRDCNLDDVNYQWDVKNKLIQLKEKL